MALRDNDRPSFGNAVTPMDMRGEEINEAAFRHMLRYMSDAGTTVFIGGPHATEFVNLNRDERRRMWEVAVDELGGKAPLYAIPFGPGSTTEMISWFKLAKSMGFDGAQLYPGAQDGHGNDGLFRAEAERYFRDILEAIDFPVHLCGYHGAEIIDAPNKRIPHDMLLALIADYPHIAGITIPYADQADLSAFVKAVDGRRPVRLAGALDWFAAMEAGAYGFHSIQQCLAPNLCSSMMIAYHMGDFEKARLYSDRLAAINEIMHRPDRYYPRTLKPALRHLGFDVGLIRRPYMPLSEAAERDLCADLDQIDFRATEALPQRALAS
jgi:4-hydroxy-tetrahydrodipicolinate synthase